MSAVVNARIGLSGTKMMMYEPQAFAATSETIKYSFKCLEKSEFSWQELNF